MFLHRQGPCSGVSESGLHNLIHRFPVTDSAVGQANTSLLGSSPLDSPWVGQRPAGKAGNPAVTRLGSRVQPGPPSSEVGAQPRGLRASQPALMHTFLLQRCAVLGPELSMCLWDESP